MSERYLYERERWLRMLETLPGVSGEEIYAMLKERGEGRRVLLCSADVRLVEHYRSLGANAMTKPAPLDDLQKAVQEIADGV